MKSLIGLVCIFATASNVLAQLWFNTQDITLSVKVPSFPSVGQDVTLEADINLGGNTLESIKWFKDNQEFYTVTPNGTQTQFVPGVVVDTAKSSQGKVILQKVTKKSSGMYKIEVNAGGSMEMRGSGMKVM